MKKNVIYIFFIFSLGLLILLLMLFNIPRNNKIVIFKSTQYKIDEIEEVASIAVKQMNKWSVNILKIWYDEDESYQKVEEYKKLRNVDEVILIYSNFKATKSSSNAGLDINKKYYNFTWIFVKNIYGKWELRDFGY